MQFRVRLVDERGALEVVRLGRIPAAPGELVLADLAGSRRFEVLRVSRDEACDAVAVVRLLELRPSGAEGYRGLVARAHAVSERVSGDARRLAS